ncbi:uncharacterized protein F54H12.2-like [Panonychus citri]|uniref:uncharacterized protein F54H12.2-like n=1 Tax=Panonychus citri TaxID=50023 RepID=UPI0023081909|nr:uncharacterized protein F54H12.2-like [Panonychus citri]
MEYLHVDSNPAGKSELTLFTVPSTQVTIESSYETEYRPSASLESSLVYEIAVPPSEDMTDMAATMLHIKVQVIDSTNEPTKNAVKAMMARNFGNALFEQVDLFLNGVNLCQASNMYHYQAFLEDLLYKFPNPVDTGNLSKKEPQFVVASRTYDLFFRLHLPICQQDRLMVNGIPMVFKLTRSPLTFPVWATTEADTETYKTKITSLSLFIRRVKLFPDAQAGLITTLNKVPAKYFIIRNEMKSFTITKDVNMITVENLFNGFLPKRIILGFVNEDAFSGDRQANPFNFDNFSVSHLALNVDGNHVPTVPYQPDFEGNLYMREFVNLYRYTGQDDGIPQCDIDYDKYKSMYCLFAFDLSSDGTLGGSHWVSVYISKNRTGIYFDSFGRQPPPEILSFILRNTSFYEISKSKYQGDDSAACGYYCLLFVLMSNKKSFFNLLTHCNHSKNEYLIYKKLLKLIK